jgi:hypothetical protein
MENAISYLIAHPVMFVIAVIVAVMVVFSSLKKMLRLVIVAAALLVLYAAYVHLSGGDVQVSVSRIEHSVEGAVRYLGGIINSLMELFRASKKQ